MSGSPCLTELEDRLEGLGTGVQDVLRAAAEAPGELPGQVHGVVADLFHVDVDTASLVEVALGERTQYVVVSSAKPLLDWLEGHPVRVADRVGFLTLDNRQVGDGARSCRPVGGAGRHGAGRRVCGVGG